MADFDLNVDMLIQKLLEGKKSIVQSRRRRLSISLSLSPAVSSPLSPSFQNDYSLTQAFDCVLYLYLFLWLGSVLLEI